LGLPVGVLVCKSCIRHFKRGGRPGGRIVGEHPCVRGDLVEGDFITTALRKAFVLCVGPFVKKCEGLPNRVAKQRLMDLGDFSAQPARRGTKEKPNANSWHMASF
jgi:hypothetical protein